MTNYMTQSTTNKLITGVASLPVAFVMLVTSFIWIPLLMIFAIPIAMGAGASLLGYAMLTRQSLSYKSMANNVSSIRGMINDTIIAFYPSKLLTLHNFGYATKEDDGIYLKNLRDNSEVF